MARGTHCLAVSSRSYPQSRNWHAAAKSSLCRLPAEAPLARYSSVLGGRELLLVPTVYLGIGLIEKILDCVEQFASSAPGVSGSHCSQLPTASTRAECPSAATPCVCPRAFAQPPVRLGDNGDDIFSVSLLLSSAFSIVLLSTPRVRRALISFVAEVVISPPCAEGLSASLNSLRSMSSSLNAIAATGICSLGCPPARSSALGS